MKKTYFLSFLTMIFSMSIYAQSQGPNYGGNTSKLNEFDAQINKCIALENRLQGETNKRTIKSIKKNLRDCRFKFEDVIYDYSGEQDYAKIGEEKAIEIISTLHAICSELIIISNSRDKNESSNIFAKNAKKMVCIDELDSSITAYEAEFCKKGQKDKPHSCTTVEKMAKNVKDRV